MTPDRQWPPVPTAPSRPKRRRVGLFTRFGLVIIGLLLFAKTWPDLRRAEGRRELWETTLRLGSSPDTYVCALVVFVNAVVYSLIVAHRYPTGADTWRGIRKTMMLFKGNELSTDSDGDEFRHFFLIVVLPFLLFAAGTAEYEFLMGWLRAP